MGAKKRPFYRLVVADARSPRDGRFIEAIGTYDPLANPAVVRVDAERVREWMSKGAKPTDIARQLLVREGVLEHTGPRFEKVEKARKLSKKQVAKDRAADEAAAQPTPEPVGEAPAAEAEPAEAASAEVPGGAAPAAPEAPRTAGASAPRPQREANEQTADAVAGTEDETAADDQTKAEASK